MFDTTSEAGGRAERRLRGEEIAWLTTVRRDGQPQSGPVWFLWDGESFLVYSQEGRQKLKNIARNPRVDINLNSSAHGDGVVPAECAAEILDNAPLANEVGPCLEKYREAIARIGYDEESFARSYSVALRLTPTRRQVW